MTLYTAAVLNPKPNQGSSTFVILLTLSRGAIYSITACFSSLSFSDVIIANRFTAGMKAAPFSAESAAGKKDFTQASKSFSS